MFDEKYMKLERCIECNKEINIGEKGVLIYKNDKNLRWVNIGEIWVHAGECWEKYKKLLTGPEAIKQGYIIGICDYCAKPVRAGDDYLAGRTGKTVAPDAPEEKDPFYIAFPLEGEVCFVHKQCDDQANQ